MADSPYVYEGPYTIERFRNLVSSFVERPDTIGLTRQHAQELYRNCFYSNLPPETDLRMPNSFRIDGIEIRIQEPEIEPTSNHTMLQGRRRVENLVVNCPPDNMVGLTEQRYERLGGSDWVLMREEHSGPLSYKIDDELRKFIFWMHQRIRPEDRLEADEKFNQMKPRIWPDE